MQPRDDNKQQAAFREQRNALWKKWHKLGMLDYKRVWSAHAADNKIAMCKEAMHAVGWSASVFDTRMEDHVASTRRKIKRARERRRSQGGASSDDPEGEVHRVDLTGSGGAAGAVEADDAKVASYSPKARISLVDGENRAMAHGVILDDEPEIPDDGLHESMEDSDWTKHHSELPECSVGSFKQVRLVGLVR